MRKYKNLLFYVVTIAAFSALIYLFLHKGRLLETDKVNHFVPQISASTWDQFKDTYFHNLTHPLAILLLQIITIILVARAFGFLCKKIKQPTVIGEIAAGIFLGPSFLKSWSPEISAFLFPPNSLGNLQFLSQIGLILFMFVIGMELDLKVLKNKAKDAVVVSHASIIFPFSLGIALSYYLYRDFAPDNINFLSFGLFTGIAMSITAFPVLARIVQERGLSKTRLGTIVITCAAADDITAWCILAVVIAIVKAGSVLSSLYTILMALAYVFVMLRLVQPFLKRIGDKYSNKEALSKPVVAVFFITLLLSSFTTEVIGIHALFGAFMAGVIMPANISFRNIFIEKVEDVSLVLLLPLFFVFTGLRTEIGLLNDPHMWGVCGMIVLVAVTGKFAGSALAARFVGQSWRDSISIGALMNTRGLMELIVLNIGYDLGVLTPEVFAMMVLMALATTFMTGPALDLVNRFMPEPREPALTEELQHGIRYNILVSFGNAAKGVSLIQLANRLVKKATPNAHVTALHLSPSSELNQFNQDEYERESFEPVTAEAEKLNLPLTPLFKPTLDVTEEIVHTANTGNFDLLLIGVGSSVFEGTLLGKILGFTNKIINPERLYDTITGKEKLFDTSAFDEQIRQVTKGAKLPVGIFVDRNLPQLENIFIPILSISDSFLLIYAQKLIHNSEARVVVLDVAGVIKQNPEFKENIRAIEQIAPNHIALYSGRNIEQAFLEQQHLMLISLDSWKKSIDNESAWLSHTPSVLIIKP
ncbi:Kef-type K+ transport system membrane component KefB [Filimonas zeae]|uniref:Cation/H(+) antiporter n=1 Tax=Filimonas zeae TaxID=1737353 RepID=A0A917INN4_9BACT|nr:cation:proton antiporter [Filimonas zeae]MDR6337474.1 Kef-type K+ transport system membrane component KefB [Filimonas zeae]GGH58802.1 cation/H(+) antiporter [Filimonas zeae]